MKPVRICMAIDYYYPVLGGSEIQACRLARMLTQMGQKVFAVTRKPPLHSDPYSGYGEQVYRLPVSGRKRVASLVFLLKVFSFLIRHRSEYDVIHCHLATSTALGCLMAGWLTKTPVLIKLGGGGKTGDIQTSLSTVSGRLKLCLLKMGNCRFVVPSMDMAREMTEKGFAPWRIKIIPNGVDTGYFSPLDPMEKGLRKTEIGLDKIKLALYIGRLAPGKDILLMIDAWAQLDENLSDWRLWIIGSGILEDAIRSRILKAGMENRIFLLPAASPDKVKDYLQVGDLFINPSKSEGLSNSILEAMSCCVPVIAARIGGNQELVRDGVNGLLFDPGDICMLARSIKRGLEDDKRRKQWGINGRKWVIDNFDLSLVAESYIHYYNKILNSCIIH